MDEQYYLAPLGEALRTMLPLMAEVRRQIYRISGPGPASSMRARNRVFAA